MSELIDEIKLALADLVIRRKGIGTVSDLDYALKKVSVNHEQWLVSLITTIESQKEEIKRLQWAASNAFDNLNQLKSADVEEAKQFLYKALTDSSSFTQDIASLKAITELAKQAFKDIDFQYMLWIDNEIDCSLAAENMDTIAENTLAEIEKLQNE